MSYLDVPRLCFAGTFMANPSTINNDATNYNPDLVNPPPPNPRNIGLVLAWNPYGSHAFTISAQVTSFVDGNGQLHTSGDPLIGASLASYIPQNVAKLVDLDTDQQGVTRLFGLFLQLVLAGSQDPSLQGEWENGGTLINLWARAPSGSGDSAFGGAFQSVLLGPVWKDLGGSSLLQQLQAAAGAGLSVRLSLYGYQDDTTSPGFRRGSISGTIGPYGAGEPLHLPPRLLMPVGSSSQLFYAPAKVSRQGTTVTIDLGNSIPDQDPGGPPSNVGTMQAAVGQPPVPLGPIDYQGTTFQQTGGVVQFPITAQQVGQPLAILVNGAPQLAENANGLYVDVDGSSLYMNPGDQASANLWATSFGSPATGVQAALALSPSTQPASALNFPSTVTTGAKGSVPIPLQASDPSPLPPNRQHIGGQLYFIGGNWAVGNVAGAPLNVKLFNSIDPPITEPTWTDVQPILYKYYYLYGYMAGIVDLSNYDDVVQNAQAIAGVLNLPLSDPNYMPVSREMSNDQRQLILTWIANGCPQGNDEKKIKTESLAASVDAGSAGAPPRRPWSGG